MVAHVCFPVWINVCCLDVTAQRECGRAAFEAAVCYSHDLSNVSEETTDSLARVRAGVATRGPLVLLHQLRHTMRLLLMHTLVHVMRTEIFCPAKGDIVAYRRYMERLITKVSDNPRYISTDACEPSMTGFRCKRVNGNRDGFS